MMSKETKISNPVGTVIKKDNNTPRLIIFEMTLRNDDDIQNWFSAVHDLEEVYKELMVKKE